MVSGIETVSLEWSALTGLMRNDVNKPLCDHCGQTLEHFLNEIEEHNLEVVCPACGKTLVPGGSEGKQEDESVQGATRDSPRTNPPSQKH